MFLFFCSFVLSLQYDVYWAFHQKMSAQNQIFVTVNYSAQFKSSFFSKQLSQLKSTTLASIASFNVQWYLNIIKTQMQNLVGWKANYAATFLKQNCKKAKLYFSQWYSLLKPATLDNCYEYSVSWDNIESCNF